MRSVALLAAAITLGCHAEHDMQVRVMPEDVDIGAGWVVEPGSCSLVLSPEPGLEEATEYAADQWDAAIDQCDVLVGTGGVPVTGHTVVTGPEGEAMPSAGGITIIDIWAEDWNEADFWLVTSIQVRLDPNGTVSRSRASSVMMHEVGHALGASWTEHDELDTLMNSFGKGFTVTDRAKTAVIERLEK